MTTSYLSAFYTLDSQVSLSSCMSIKTSLSSLWLYVVSLIQFPVLQIITVLWKIKKKKGRKEEQIKYSIP